MSEALTKSNNERPPKKQKMDRHFQTTNLSLPSENLKKLLSFEENPFFKLNIDCFNEIFDYLPTEDLFGLEQTCRLMQQLVGEYVEENYSSAAKLDKTKFLEQTFSSGIPEHATTGVYRFIKHISLNGLNRQTLTSQSLRCIESCASAFTSLNHLCLEAVDLTAHWLIGIQSILQTLEIVELKQCSLNCNFYESFLKHCINLKRLYISSSTEDIIQASENEWLLKTYPKLEHLGLVPRKQLRFNMNELDRFFELNPKVKSFSTNYRFLWENQVEFAESSIQLHELGVIVHQKGMTLRMESVFGLLNELHDRCFYKKLALRMPEINEDYTEGMTKLQGLEKLSVNFLDQNCGLQNVSNLKQLTVVHATPRVDMSILAEKLVNLERYLGNLTYIKPFCRHGTKLSRIVLMCQNESLNESVNANESLFDVTTLNNERKKLKNARKVTIFAPDHCFVTFKWMNGDLDKEFVRIKRC